MNTWLLIHCVILPILLQSGNAAYNMDANYTVEGDFGIESEIPLSLAIDIIQDAFDVWGCYSGLKFKKVGDPKQAQIHIIIGGEGHMAYDGNKRKIPCQLRELGGRWESGVGVAAHSSNLLHAHMPGNIHIDSGEVWTYGRKNRGSVSFLDTMTHEIGHVLFLQHKDVRKSRQAVMSGDPRKFVHPKDFDLTKADVKAFRLSGLGILLDKRKLLPKECTDKKWQRVVQKRMDARGHCGDRNSMCSYFQRDSDYCGTQYEAVSHICRGTCSFCECKDLGNFCTPQLCLRPDFLNRASYDCRMTCGYCPSFISPWVMFENTIYANKPCRDEAPANVCKKAKTDMLCGQRNAKIPLLKFCRKTCNLCK